VTSWADRRLRREPRLATAMPYQAARMERSGIRGSPAHVSCRISLDQLGLRVLTCSAMLEASCSDDIMLTLYSYPSCSASRTTTVMA
jgi:hypothetical protein